MPGPRPVLVDRTGGFTKDCIPCLSYTLRIRNPYVILHGFPPCSRALHSVQPISDDILGPAFQTLQDQVKPAIRFYFTTVILSNRTALELGSWHLGTPLGIWSVSKKAERDNKKNTSLLSIKGTVLRCHSAHLETFRTGPGRCVVCGLVANLVQNIANMVRLRSIRRTPY